MMLNLSHWQRCSAKEVCIGALEQLDPETACHFNKFVSLLDTLEIGKSIKTLNINYH